MNKSAKAIIVALLSVGGGIVALKYDDGSVAEIDGAFECTYQPPGLRPPPCLADGGFTLADSDYLDAGCLAEVCPRHAEIIASGKSATFWTKEMVDRKLAAKAAAAAAAVVP